MVMGAYHDDVPIVIMMDLNHYHVLREAYRFWDCRTANGHALVAH